VAGRILTFTDDAADLVLTSFVQACAARGANGIGAGVGYMGNRTLHVGFGTSPSDHSELTWGAGGKSANAPQWLRDAASAGWSAPIRGATTNATQVSAGTYEVVARDGLKLRLGPGTIFDSPRTLPLGTEVHVLGFDGPDGAWARVDLEGDGLIDGHVFAAFLAVSNTTAEGDETEPD
jgi:hypothetical protein